MNPYWQSSRNGRQVASQRAISHAVADKMTERIKGISSRLRSCAAEIALIPEIAGYSGALDVLASLTSQTAAEVSNALDDAILNRKTATIPEWIRNLKMDGPDPFPMDTGEIPHPSPPA